LGACGGGRQVAAPPCHPDVRMGVLPAWARGGFSDPRPRMPYTLGRSGRIAAIVWGFPLTAPPDRERRNKILWVPRRFSPGVTEMRIRAQRMEGTRSVGRPVARMVPGGPGPSIVDLPRSGCWRLRLSWAGQSDRLDARYLRR
jgi:hypothetical protein